MGSKRSELISQGVDPRIASRGSGAHVVMHEGKVCRDRLPWGGFTEPDRCSCEGRCAYDMRATVSGAVRRPSP